MCSDINNKVTRLVKMLQEKQIQLGVCESLTGGMLASTIVDVSGASSIFKGSIVAYCPTIKTKLLGVDKNLIEEHGTVDPQVAIQMVRGARKQLEVDLAVSTTGVAGPGWHEGKEAGTVYVGISFLNKETYYLYKTTGTRTEIRCNTVNFCVDKLIELLSSLEDN